MDHPLSPEGAQVNAEAAIHELLTSTADVRTLIGVVGNHAAKGVAFLTLWQQQSPTSLMDFHTQIVARSDGEIFFSSDQYEHYCKESLKSAGIVDQITIKNVQKKSVQAYWPTAERLDQTVSTVGLLLDWSLRYPELSLQHILGRLPAPRLAVLTALFAQDTHGSAFGVSKIGSLTGVGHKTASAFIDFLADADLVVKDSVYNSNDRRYKVLNPGYTGNRALAKLKTETQLFYEFLSQFSVGGEFTHQQVLDYIEKGLAGRRIEFDPIELRRYWGSVLGGTHNKAIPGVERLHTFNNLQMTRVTVGADFRKPLRELMEIIRGLSQEDIRVIEYGQQRALEIINDPNAVKVLLAKAREFSSKPNHPEKLIGPIVMQIVRLSQVPLSVDEVYRQAQQVRKGRIAKKTIACYLEALERNGEVKVEKIAKDSSSRRKVRRYVAIDKQSD